MCSSEREYEHNDKFSQEAEHDNERNDVIPLEGDRNEIVIPKNIYMYVIPEARSERDLTKHPLLPPCQPQEEGQKSGCGKRCSEEFSSDVRKMIHAEFWNLTYYERVSWLGSVIQTKSPARPRNLTKQLRSRQDTRVYTLSSLNCERFIVCKTFFLSTLGLNSDQMTKAALAKRKGNFIRSVPDKRGRHEPFHK